MIDDLQLIEKMEKLLEVGEGDESKSWTAEQNLGFVMGAVRGIISNAQKRIDETEKEYAPDHQDPYETWLENERIERILNNL